ncbi:hypothetical protein MHBO_004270, partial [Bonamia ostreae]
KIFYEQMKVLRDSYNEGDNILIGNVTMTVGILCFSFPSKSGYFLHHFAKEFLKALERYPFSREKTIAIKGVLMTANKSPKTFLFCFGTFCKAVILFGIKDFEIKNAVLQVINMYRIQ